MSVPSPAAIMERLAAIEADLAERQNAWEQAAQAHYLAVRDAKKKRAEVFLGATGTVAERSALADLETALHGNTAEADYEAQKAAVRVLDTRAAIGMALLKAQGRGA